MVALPDTSLSDALPVAQRLHRAVADLALPFEGGERGAAVTVTIGIVEARPDEDNLEVLIHRADKALYVGKRDGRDQVVACRESQA